MSYILGNTDLSTFGIVAGRAPNSNICLQGFLDMPKRIGDISYEWDDENGDEPFVDIDDLAYEGRQIIFHGILTEGFDSYIQLKSLYDLINSFTDLVDFETPYGTFSVYVESVIPEHFNSATKVTITMKEPVVDLSGTIPQTGESDYLIDGIPFSTLGLYVSKKKDYSSLEKMKDMNFIKYGSEGYQMTKRKANTVSIEAFVIADDFATFKSKISSVYAVLSAAGIRDLTLPFDTDSIVIECYSKDGFNVSGILIDSKVIAKINLKLEANNKNLLSDLSLLFDSNGDPLYDSYSSRLTSLN